MAKKKITDQERIAFSRIGRIGGLSNAAKGKKYMSALGKRGALSRWRNHKKNEGKRKKN
jgi:hypothetical protein